MHRRLMFGMQTCSDNSINLQLTNSGTAARLSCSMNASDRECTFAAPTTAAVLMVAGRERCARTTRITGMDWLGCNE